MTEKLTDDRVFEIYRDCREPTLGWALRFARAIEREVLAPTQQPNYCDIHCKKFCQNSVHGMCDGPPKQQPSDECPHGIDDGACKECYHAATDTERLDWVMHRLSGKALRDIGVVYCEGNPAETRANIDAAIDQKGEFSEQQPSGTTSTGSLAFDYAHAEVARKLGIRNPLVSNHQTSVEVMEKRILELADKYRIDYGGDYSRNAKEHELDLLAFVRAVLPSPTQQPCGEVTGWQPIASVVKSSAGPYLLINGQRIFSWLGTMYNDEADRIAQVINDAARTQGGES
ncbi:hypothetical protein [Burkholderia pseudomallei]|uniref:hypothetical protein n=1 Tax=Burkholderia pseudomallei TaxID=28450 RepID=UPI000A6889E9|nr:hypothetical protein [Burkholderia pseudomallei]